MKKYFLALLLGSWGTSLFATPLSFTSSQYQTGAFASVGLITDSHFDASPPSSPSLLTSATAELDPDSASSAGTTDTGFLGASVDVTSVTQTASGLSSAEFSGQFIAPGGPVLLTVNFDSQSSVLNGTAGNQLSLVLIGNGVTLLDETFTVSGVIGRAVALPAGTSGFLDFLLTSSADVTAGSAFNLTTATFNVSVPEAPTLFIFLPGLMLLLFLQRCRRPAAGETRAL